MKLHMFLSSMMVALRQLFRGDRSIPAKTIWRGRYYRAYPSHTTIIHYPDGVKVERGDQAFFIPYERHPEFRNVDTAQIGNFQVVGDQAIWKAL